jgi:hypothetical protein
MPCRRNGGTVVGSLAGGRHSTEGEHVVVEPSCGGPLAEDPESVNPRLTPVSGGA